MPIIRANRDSIDDRFSVVGFSIRTESPLFEVGIATDPELFRPENRIHRNHHNFFSSRAGGALRARRGEAVYLVPAEVLANFIGNRRLYFGLATYSDNNRSRPDFVQSPNAGNAYISISGLTERGLRRLAPRPSSGSSYGGGGNGADVSLAWGGDSLVVVGSPPLAPTAGPGPAAALKPNGTAKGNGAAKPNGTAKAAPAAIAAVPAATAQEYDDGYGKMPERPPGEADDNQHGVEGPIPDAGTASAAQALRPDRTLEAPKPEYPQAQRFVPAAAENYRSVSSQRTVNRIVIHITDGSPNINGTVSWFQNPQAGVSAHYVVGQDGEVVQMVRDNDVAWHARSANGDSIGIEHVANTRGLKPTPQEYGASAALVSWLCGQFGIPIDRAHIQGHSEADPQTSHTGCPNAVWDWDYYTGLLSSGAAARPQATASGLALAAASGRKTPFRRRSVAIAQELLVKEYGGGGLAEQLRFFAESVAWFAGVPNTSSFPHSAICQVRSPTTSGDEEMGSAFYVGRNLLLTAAHVVENASSLIVVPGKNGAGTSSQTEPFGRFTVKASNWVVHESYRSESRDFDLALIRTPQAAPNGQWFSLLEELAQCRAEGVVVCGYSMQSNQTAVISQLVNMLIDPNVQHLHAGAVRDLPNDELFDYDIQTLPGASGSPVYWIESGSGSTAHLVGVHVAGDSDTTNRGCRLTTAKIAWIQARAAEMAAAQSLDVHPRPHQSAPGTAASRDRRHRAAAAGLDAGSSFAVHWDTTPYYPQTSSASCWAASAAMVTGWRDNRQVTDSEIAAKVPAFDAYKKGLFPSDRRALADAWNLTAEPPSSYTLNSWRDLLTNYGPIYVDMTWDTSGNGGHVRVLVGMESDGAPDGSDTTMFMHDPWPDTPGKIKLSFADFLALYEGRVGNEGQQLQYQILHADKVPAGLKPVLAAPFALTAAGEAESRADSPPATGFVRAVVPASAPRTADTDGMAAGAVISPIVSDNDSDEVTYELDQLNGWRHPDDTVPSSMPEARDGTPIRLEDWPRIDILSGSPSHTEDVPVADKGVRLSSTGAADTITGGVEQGSKDSATFAGFEIRWQYTGQSVGNVAIRNTSVQSAGGWKLHVRAKIVRHTQIHSSDDPKVAGLSIKFTYHFSHRDEADQIAVTHVRLLGNGTRTIDFRWAEA